MQPANLEDCMKLLKNRQNLVSLAGLALLLALALPGTAFADQRNRGQGSNYDKRARKCGKFVNCHDARDGRWDGKGPQRNRNSRYYRRYRVNNRRDDARFRNRSDRRFDVREVNRVNTVRIRRGRG